MTPHRDPSAARPGEVCPAKAACVDAIAAEADRREHRPTRTCRTCGSAFPLVVVGQRFCGPRCAERKPAHPLPGGRR